MTVKVYPHLSTLSRVLSTPSLGNLKALTSTFLTYPQKSSLPITTTFIYKYLSPQADRISPSVKNTHSSIRSLYVKLSNLEGVYSQMIEMRASA